MVPITRKRKKGEHRFKVIEKPEYFSTDNLLQDVKRCTYSHKILWDACKLVLSRETASKNTKREIKSMPLFLVNKDALSWQS
jgi:hypothetical protein